MVAMTKCAVLLWPIALMAAALAVAVPAVAQDSSGAPVAVAGAGQPSQPADTPSAVDRIQRWIDWQAGTIETRYRYVETSAGLTTSNQQQHKQTLRVALKLDPEARYGIVAGAATGGSLTSGWDNLGIGRGDPTWDLSLRQLYLSASPIDGVEGQLGGLYAVRGEQTEITSYDNDTYLMGTRVSVKRPARFYLDEITATFGHLGDIGTPNVFRRFRQLDEHNFSQVLMGKEFGSLVSASAEWTAHEGISTLRQAVRVATREWLPLDSVRFEQYQRIEGDQGYGFGIAAQRALTKRLTVSGGFASIDDRHPPLNGDRYLRGRRVFGEARYQVRPELTLATFYTQAFDDDFVIPNQHRFEIVLSYDVLKALQGAGAW